MKTAAIIQARMRSSRLPGKVLLPILGRPMLELMIERLRRVPSLDGIVIATSTHASCDPIERLAGTVGVGCFRGSEEDVLDRVLQAARWAAVDLIVEVTGDCPLIDPETVARVIETFKANDVDYCSNVIERTYPRGLDVQVFPRRILEDVAGLTSDPADREHVSLYIYEHPKRYRLLNVPSGLPSEDQTLRLTVDTPEDFRLVSEIYQRLYPVNQDFGLREILTLLRREPHLRTLNSNVQQKLVR